MKLSGLLPLIYGGLESARIHPDSGCLWSELGFRGRELAVSGLRLIGDIGGTNARFAIAENGAYRDMRHVEVDRYPSLHDALVDYLGMLPEADRTSLTGVLAIAGPVLGDKISMTNKAWSFS